MPTLLLTLLACAPPTCDEVEGAICADDLADWMDDTAPPSGWAWFDAEGRQVTIDAELLWEDDDGVIWQVDPVGAVPYPLAISSLNPVRRWFESNDCSGAALVFDPPPPGFAYGLDGQDVLVWWGGAVEGPTIAGSIELDGTCIGDRTEASTTTARWADVDVVEGVPAPGWTSPLYLQAL